MFFRLNDKVLFRHYGGYGYITEILCSAADS